MAQRIQIPVLILTGFLGSGKTTLLSQWLRAPEFDGAMVIVNELGEVGLDDRLVQHSSDVPLLLENGCACCEAAEDLNATLERLFWQRLHRQIPKYNWVLIETTGVADPNALLASLRSHQLVNERYVVSAVVTAFDAKCGPTQLKDFSECRSQVDNADAVILTKTDLAAPDEAAAARGAIEARRPGTLSLQSANASLTAAELLAAIDPLAGTGALRSASVHSHHSHAGHDHSHHTDAYSTAFVALPDPLEWSALEAALRSVLDAHEDTLLRLKGTARTGAGKSIEAIQAVSGDNFERRTLAQDEEAKPIKTGLTIIARAGCADEIAAGLVSWLGLILAPPHAHIAEKGDSAHGR